MWWMSHVTQMNILRCDMTQYEWVMSHSWTYSGVTWLIYIESCHTHEHIQVWLCPYVWHASIWICHVIWTSHVTLIFRYEEWYHTQEHSRHDELCHSLEHTGINESQMSHLSRMNTFRFDYAHKGDMPEYEQVTWYEWVMSRDVNESCHVMWMSHVTRYEWVMSRSS